MEIRIDDAMRAAGALRDAARSFVRSALSRRTGRKHKKWTDSGRSLLVLAKQHGMAARRIQASIKADLENALK